MLFFFIEYNGDLPVLDSFPTRRSSDLTRRSFVGSSLRERRAEHGETALRFGFRRLVLHDVPVLRETSSRSEEHTSELQSHSDIVCRLLLEKKKTEHWEMAQFVVGIMRT